MKKSPFPTAYESALDGVCYFLNMGVGYVSAQALTTFNRLYKRLLDSDERKQEAKLKEQGIIPGDGLGHFEDKYDNPQVLGGLLGMLTDGLLVAGTVLHLAGDESQLTTIAATATAIKAGINIASLAADSTIRKFSRPKNKEVAA